MDYGTKVRVLRAARGISQTELAEISGIPNYNLSLIESGKMLPGAEWDRAIRQALRWPENAEIAFAILEGGEEVCGEQEAREPGSAIGAV